MELVYGYCGYSNVDEKSRIIAEKSERQSKRVDDILIAFCLLKTFLWTAVWTRDLSELAGSL